MLVIRGFEHPELSLIILCKETMNTSDLWFLDNSFERKGYIYSKAHTERSAGQNGLKRKNDIEVNIFSQEEVGITRMGEWE